MTFGTIDSVEQARGKLRERFGTRELPSETLPLANALGRVTAKTVYAPADIPPFPRSAMDGYAVVSGDTAAASDALPAMLTLRGEVLIGHEAGFTIKRGECAYIPTGGMLPGGANAVVMVEYSEAFGGDKMLIQKPAAPGEHVVQIGDDIRSGEMLLPRGRRLRPSDIGALAAAGLAAVSVYAPLRLTILSTGDELAIPGDKRQPGQVYDINTHALGALAEANGFAVMRAETLPDDEALLEQTIRTAMTDSDIVAVSGGSSRGKADITEAVLRRVADVFTAGIALKPGKPTLFAYDAATQTLLAGLPGHPVSAMLVFETFLCDLVRKMTGSEAPPGVPARLSEPVPASPGKHTLCPVTLAREGDGYAAHPVWGKSGLITTLSGADGYISIEAGAEGLPSGSTVLVLPV